MAEEQRQTIAAGDNYSIEFVSRGSGFYYATVKGDTKGPFPSEQHARNYVINKLQGIVNSFDEDEVATREAIAQADLIEGEQAAAADAGDPNWRDAGNTVKTQAELDAEEEAQLRADQERKRQERELAAQREAAEEDAQADADAQREAQLAKARAARKARREGQA